jgi:hypothetical protein
MVEHMFDLVKVGGAETRADTGSEGRPDIGQKSLRIPRNTTARSGVYPP